MRLEGGPSPTVEDLQAQIGQLKDQLHRAAQRAGERARELESARAKLEREAKRRDRFEVLRARVDELRAEREHAAFAEAKLQLEAERRALEARAAELAAREKQLDASRAELAERDEQLRERAAQLDAHEAELAADKVRRKDSDFRAGLSSLGRRIPPPH